MSGDAVSGKDNTTSILNGYQGQRAVRLFAPVYGPALLLVLAGCHKAGHIGPKPNTGAPEMAPFIAGEIDGLDGPETMSFAAADERVYADLATDGVQPDQAVYFQGETEPGEGTETSAGSAAGLDLRAYAHLIGTGFADHLLGDSEMNIIVGEGGDDLIEGRGGADQPYGAYGQDRLHGGSGEDKLYGGAGDAWLLGGWQADRLDGGAGTDTASCRSSQFRVTVDLEAPGGLQDETIGNAPKIPKNKPGVDRNHSYGDVLMNIENLEGSAYADRLSGDSGANTLTGLDGKDILVGRGGDDILIGGPGADVLTGGDGADRFVLDTDNPAALLELADLITDFSAEDSLDTGDLTHIWMKIDSDSGIRHAENDNTRQDTIIYAGTEDGSGPDTGKILAVLFDYVDPIVSDDVTIQPVMPELG